MLVKQKKRKYEFQGELNLSWIHNFSMNLLVVFLEGIQCPQICGEFAFCAL
jgi:hypothetical protein